MKRIWLWSLWLSVCVWYSYIVHFFPFVSTQSGIRLQWHVLDWATLWRPKECALCRRKKPPRHKVRIKPKWVVNAVVCEKVNESKISHNKRGVKQKPAGCLRQLCAVCIHTFCLANACGDNLVLTHYFSKWKKKREKKMRLLCWMLHHYSRHRKILYGVCIVGEWCLSIARLFELV